MTDSKPKSKRGPHRWTKGTAPKSPGRPPKAAEENYLAAIKRAITAEDMEAIAAKARDQARRGDRYAREWVSKQFGTEAAQKIEQDVRSTVVSVDAPLAVDGDVELERLVREAAARVYGPKPDPPKVETPPANGTNGTTPHA